MGNINANQKVFFMRCFFLEFRPSVSSRAKPIIILSPPADIDDIEQTVQVFHPNSVCVCILTASKLVWWQPNLLKTVNMFRPLPAGAASCPKCVNTKKHILYIKTFVSTRCFLNMKNKKYSIVKSPIFPVCLDFLPLALNPSKKRLKLSWNFWQNTKRIYAIVTKSSISEIQIQHAGNTFSWTMMKTLMTFHAIGWLKRIFTVAYCNPYITG